MSEKMRTPSPVSSDARSSRARGRRSSGSSLARTASARPRSNKLFESVRKAIRDVEPGLLRDLNETGRTGDIDLGQEVADDIEADHEQSFGRQLGTDALGDLAITRGKRARDAKPADREIAPGLAGLRDPCQNMRD